MRLRARSSLLVSAHEAVLGEGCIAAMGGHAERMVEQAVAALVNADPGLAQKVIRDDAVLDEGQREIDDKAIIIIAKRQPMAPRCATE